MRKLIFKPGKAFYLFLLVLICSGAINKSFATHIYGADFFYTHVSGNTYTVSLVVYGDCSGSAFPSLSTASPLVQVFNGSSTTPFTSARLIVQSPTNGVEVTPVCPSQINNTTCNNGSIPGVKKFVYSRNFTLNTTSTNWRFLFTGDMGTNPSGQQFSAGRSTSISNINQSLNGSIMQLEATLNNTSAANSSPVYTTIPTPFFCVNKAASYNPGTVDPNSDSLAYALVPGLEPGTIVTYISPYSATAPLATATGSFNFSNTTGQLNFTPNLVQRSLVVNRVSEYKNGVLVGTSMREMTFVVLNNCNNRPPGGIISNISGGTAVNNTTVKICKSSGFLSFKINSSDSDGNSINVVASGIPAGASFNITSNNSTAPQGSFSWNLSSVNAGTYTFFLTYTDDGCPLSSKQTLAYTIQVKPDPKLVYTRISPATCTKKQVFTMTPSIDSPWAISIYQGAGVLHSFPTVSATQTDSLSPGTYTIRLSNTNGCYKDTQITITLPPPIIPSAAIVQPICYGDSNGKITITASGGLAPFKYAIGTGAYGTNNIFQNLYASNYTFHILDSNDCIKDTTVTLPQPIPVDAAITFQQPPCNFYNSGVITVNGVNGITPYQYALGIGTFGNPNTFSGLFSGTYVLHIKDANGCLKDSTFILPDSVKVHANPLLTHILCHGDSTGTITLNAFGATAPYYYQISGGNLGSNNSFTNLPAGPFSFHIEDTNKCYLDTIISLTQPDTFKLKSTVTGVLCFGEANGTITALVSGGTSPYIYAIGAGTYSSNNIFTGLPEGTYTIHIKDSNNCVIDSPVKVTQPAKLAITTITSVTPSCYSFTNGTLTINGTGGTTPYSYALNTGAYQSSNFFNNLATGNITVHLQDVNNCQDDTTIFLDQPTPIVPTAQLKNSTCKPLNDGVVTLGGTGGTPAYTYAVNSGSYSVNPVFNALPANAYTFHIKDNRGCVKDTIITVTDSLVISGTPNVSDATCFNDSNGTITVIPFGGVSPYTFSIASGSYQSNSTFTNLSAGNHVLRIRDNLGCEGNISATVGEPTLVIPNATVKTISCYGYADGSIIFQSSGGISPYTYAMGNGPYSSNNNINNISPGLYLYHIKDGNGCIIDTIIHISQPAPIGMTFSITNNTCYGDSSGTVTVNAAGGNSPYTYKADNGNFQTGNILSGLTAGVHTIYVVDSNKCMTSKAVSLSQPTPLLISDAMIVNPTCDGYTDGSVIISPKGGNPPYLFAMNNGTTVTGTEFKELAEGDYLFTVIDSNNCTYDTLITLQGLPDIIIDNTNIDDVTCFGKSDGRLEIEVTGGVQPLKYSIDQQPAVDSGNFDDLGAGAHTIIITDSMNCVLDTNISVGSPERLTVNVTAVPNDCEGYDDGGMVGASVTGGTPPYSYLWSTDPPRTESQISGLVNGKYYVIILDAHKCKDSAIADITYDNCCKISIPDAFSPNGDGRNDKIRIILKGQFNLKVFAIYNRFGQMVFSTNVVNGYYSDGWDGKVNGIIQDIGTYNYYVVGSCGAGEKDVQYKGTIMLIK